MALVSYCLAPLCSLAQEHYDLYVEVPRQRYTGHDIQSPFGASFDLYLTCLPCYSIVESHIVAQEEGYDDVMWWKINDAHYKVDMNDYTLPWSHPPVQNSREWLEVAGKLERKCNGGGGGGLGGDSGFVVDVVAADLDVVEYGSG